MRRRRIFNTVFSAFTGLCALLACTILFGTIFAIVWRGLPAIRWEFLTTKMSAGGASGGVLYHILGTLILLGTALAVVLPLAVGLALLNCVYLPTQSRLRAALRRLLQLLNSVPSIVLGIFGLMVFVQALGWGKSWLAGGIVLGILILPTVTVALAERIEQLPAKFVEAAAGLGLRTSQIVWSVILPQTLGGLTTGILLGLARAAGETAPIMFTATIFAGETIPHGIKESPVLSLPYHIFVLAQDSLDANVATKVWGTAAVLVALVFSLSLLALPMRLGARDKVGHA